MEREKCIAFQFKQDILVPKGTRLFGINGKPFVVPGPNGTTEIYVHPDDLHILQQVVQEQQ